MNENIKKEMTDRLTDKNKKNKSFEDVLTEIGFPNRLSKESFQYGFVSQDIENLKKCSIPISYHSDKKAMRESLEFFAQYNYACNGFTEQSDLTLYKQVIDILCNFSEKEKTYLNGGFISYRQIIDALNDKIHEHGDLYEWVVMVMDEWKSLNASKKVTPRNPVAYLRTCIWNWLKGNELELKESAYGYSAAVTITARNSQNNGEPKVLAAPGSTFGEYWSDMKKTTAQRQNNQNNGEPKIIAAPGSTVGECWNAMNKTPKKAEKTTLPFGFTMDEYMAYLQRKSEDMQRKRA